MLPTIDKKKTGIHLRKLMDARGFSVKDIQKYLGLGSVQSVYHWLNGISLPTIDNLYALSELFQIPIDNMLCGTRQNIQIIQDIRVHMNEMQLRRMRFYFEKMIGLSAA